jgi:replicative DNA helicase
MIDTPTGRIPPNDEAAERSVIGSTMLAADRVFPLVSDLAVDDFFLPHHREAWAAILAVIERRMPVDTIAVGSELQARGVAARFEGGWMSWAVGAMSEVSAWQNVGHHAGSVKAMATLRRMIALVAEVSSAAYASHPVEEVMEMARSGVARLEVSSRAGGPERVGDLLSGVIDDIEKRTAGTRPPGIPIHVGALSDILTAWKAARMYIVAGRPGDGKTAFAAQESLEVALGGFPVLFFSREMLAAELVERNLARRSRVPAYHIGSGKLDYGKWQQIQSAAGIIQPAPLWYDDRTATIEGMMATARKWHAIEVRGRAGDQHMGSDGKPLGLIVLDYLQLARVAKSRGSNREQVVAEMSRGMKELASELKCPVMVMSQLNREAEKRGGRPMLGDLRESGAIEQDADVILFVYRDIPPEEVSRRREPGEAELIVGKHRGGPTGIAKVWIDPPMMEFRDRKEYQPEPLDTKTEPGQTWATRGDF